MNPHRRQGSGGLQNGGVSVPTLRDPPQSDLYYRRSHSGSKEHGQYRSPTYNPGYTTQSQYPPPPTSPPPKGVPTSRSPVSLKHGKSKNRENSRSPKSLQRSRSPGSPKLNSTGRTLKSPRSYGTSKSPKSRKLRPGSRSPNVSRTPSFTRSQSVGRSNSITRSPPVMRSKKISRSAESQRIKVKDKTPSPDHYAVQTRGQSRSMFVGQGQSSLPAPSVPMSNYDRRTPRSAKSQSLPRTARPAQHSTDRSGTLSRSSNQYPQSYARSNGSAAHGESRSASLPRSTPSREIQHPPRTLAHTPTRTLTHSPTRTLPKTLTTAPQVLTSPRSHSLPRSSQYPQSAPPGSSSKSRSDSIRSPTIPRSKRTSSPGSPLSKSSSRDNSRPVAVSVTLDRDDKTERSSSRSTIRRRRSFNKDTQGQNVKSRMSLPASAGREWMSSLVRNSQQDLRSPEVGHGYRKPMDVYHNMPNAQSGGVYHAKPAVVSPVSATTTSYVNSANSAVPSYTHTPTTQTTSTHTAPLMLATAHSDPRGAHSYHNPQIQNKQPHDHSSIHRRPQRQNVDPSHRHSTQINSEQIIPRQSHVARNTPVILIRERNTDVASARERLQSKSADHIKIQSHRDRLAATQKRLGSASDQLQYWGTNPNATSSQGQGPDRLQGATTHPHAVNTSQDYNNRAAELMTRTGHTVTLTVGKQGAIYHGLGALLNTPSPTLQRAVGSPRRSQGAGGKGMNRPKSEDVARYGPQDGPGGYPSPSPGGHYDPMQRPLHQQMGAQSSPALTVPLMVDGEVDASSGPPLEAVVAKAEARDQQAFWADFVTSGHLNANLVTAKSSEVLNAWRRSRSQEALREDPYGPGPYGPGGPGGLPQSQSYHNDLHRGGPNYPGEPANALRSKSTSNLDRPDAPYGGNDYRPSMSMGTLPGRGGPPPQGQPQRGTLDRPGSQPELYQPDLRWIGPDQDRDYENYPGPGPQQPQPQQPPHQQGPPDRFGPPGMDPRFQQPAQPNYMNHQQIRDLQYGYGTDPRNDPRAAEHPGQQRPDQGIPGRDPQGMPPHGMPPQARGDQGPPRPRSQQEMDRVAEWQRQNEPWDQRGYGAPPPQGVYGQDPEPGRPPHPQEEPPRGGGPGPAQYPGQQFPSTGNLRGREATPPGGPPQPNTPTKPTGMRHPQDMGRPDSRQQDMGRMGPPDNRMDGRPDMGRMDSMGRPEMGGPQGRPQDMGPRSDSRQGANMYDPRLGGPPPHQQQQPGGPPNGFPPSSQYPGSTYSQGSQGLPPHHLQYGSPQAETRTVPSARDKTSPPSRQDYRRNETPDLPPPPPDVPPPGTDPRDWHPHVEELPPPPPPAGSDLEQQIREEQEIMMKRMAGLDPYGRADPRGAPPPHDQRFVSNKQQPEPQRPSPPGVNYPPGYNPNQPNNNTGPRQSLGQPQPSPQPRPNNNYPYVPKKENKLRPSDANIHLSNTSLNNTNQKRPPVSAKPKMMPKPNQPVSPSPWERDEKDRINKIREEDMTRLRDQEIAALEDKPYRGPEEQERLRRLRLDQEFERRVKEASKDDDDEGDSDNDDITDRPAGRAVLFRQMQEDLEKKRHQIVEGHAQRDREQEQAGRDKVERQERRLQQFEAERDEQKQRQMKRQDKQEREAEAYLAKQRDLRERQRREQEEQQRSMRIEEERRIEKQREDLRRKREMEKEQMREIAAAREAEERAIREEEMRQKDINSRNDRFSYDPAYRAQPAPPSQPPPPQPTYPPPTPPERRSSYDIAGLRGNNMGDRYVDQPPMPGQPGTPRGMSALRQVETPSSAKKSVSFNSNLAIEINEKQMQYGSTSSEASLYGVQTSEANNNNSSGYPYRGSSSSSTSDPPPTPFQRPNYGAGTPQQQPENNEVFDQRTPTNQGPPPQLIPGPTPGVVGAQEIYRDPRDRIAAKKAATAGNRGPGPERMSFRDKMSMFAKEAGEQHTPKDRQKTSRAQRVIETDLNGQSVA